MESGAWAPLIGHFHHANDVEVPRHEGQHFQKKKKKKLQPEKEQRELDTCEQVRVITSVSRELEQVLVVELSDVFMLSKINTFRGWVIDKIFIYSFIFCCCCFS